ncbi:MAG: 5-formyltetrahydrofolate cyclo-ligase [Nannocystaceae bacterium]
MGRADLIITGSVGVNLEGARLGKGGGYADLEFSLLRRYGKLSETVLVATTVHPSQLCEAGEIEMRTNDVPIDLIATPTSVIRCPRIFGRPSTIDEDLLDPAKRAAMPPIDAALDTPRASEARVPSKIDDDTVTDETEGTS